MIYCSTLVEVKHDLLVNLYTIWYFLKSYSFWVLDSLKKLRMISIVKHMSTNISKTLILCEKFGNTNTNGVANKAYTVRLLIMKSHIYGSVLSYLIIYHRQSVSGWILIYSRSISSSLSGSSFFETPFCN